MKIMTLTITELRTHFPQIMREQVVGTETVVTVPQKNKKSVTILDTDYFNKILEKAAHLDEIQAATAPR